MRKNKRSLRQSVEGAISLFLVMLMLPFITIALVFVESGRYNAAVSMLDEAMGVSALSVLADYDPYLKARWGLLATKQKSGQDSQYLTSRFTQYLETNMLALGNSYSSGEDEFAAVAQGMNAYNSMDVFEKELMEYCKLNVPTKLLEKGGENLFSTLISTFGGDGINNVKKTLGNVKNIGKTTAEACDKGLQIIDHIDNLIRLSERLEDNLEELHKICFDTEAVALGALGYVEPLRDYAWEYRCQYIDFKDGKRDDPPENNPAGSVDPLAYRLKEYDTTIEKIKNQIESISRELTEAVNASKELAQKANQLDTDITSMTSEIAMARQLNQQQLDEARKQLEDMEKFREDIGYSVSEPGNYNPGVASDWAAASFEAYRELEQRVRDLEKMQKDLDNQYKAEQKNNNKIKQELDESIERVGGDTLDNLKVITDNLKDTVDNAVRFVRTAFSVEDTENKLKVLRDDVTNQDEMGKKLYPDLKRSYPRPIDFFNLRNALEEQIDNEKGGFAYLKKLLDVLDKFGRVSVFFEPALNAKLPADYGGYVPIGFAPESTDYAGVFIQRLNKMCSDIGDAITKKGWDKVRAIKDLCFDDGSGNGGSVQQCVNAFQDLLDHIAAEIMEKIYVAEYISNNLSCRTDYKANWRDPRGKIQFRTMTGYSMANAGLVACSVVPPVASSLWSLFGTLPALFSGSSGNDMMFKGAELEYIIGGSTSEEKNQIMTFFMLYVIRFVVDILPVLNSEGIQGIAATVGACTFGAGYYLVLIAALFLEPLAEVTILANGGKIKLLGETVLIAPEGIPTLATKLFSGLSLSEPEKKAVEDMYYDFTNLDKEEVRYNEDRWRAEQENAEDASVLNIGDTISNFIDLSLSYRQYCFIVLAVFLSKKNALIRLNTLVQMETAYYYTNGNAPSKIPGFSLERSYTSIFTYTNGSVRRIFPTPINSNAYSFERSIYRGY